MRCGTRAFEEKSEGDQQQLSMSMRPYTKTLVLDVEAQQLRNPVNDQLLHRMVRAIRKVSPMGSLWEL
jgi:hypothetical protein